MKKLFGVVVVALLAFIAWAVYDDANKTPEEKRLEAYADHEDCIQRAGYLPDGPDKAEAMIRCREALAEAAPGAGL